MTFSCLALVKSRVSRFSQRLKAFFYKFWFVLDSNKRRSTLYSFWKLHLWWLLLLFLPTLWSSKMYNVEMPLIRSFAVTELEYGPSPFFPFTDCVQLFRVPKVYVFQFMAKSKCIVFDYVDIRHPSLAGFVWRNTHPYLVCLELLG